MVLKTARSADLRDGGQKPTKIIKVKTILMCCVGTSEFALAVGLFSGGPLLANDVHDLRGCRGDIGPWAINC